MIDDLRIPVSIERGQAPAGIVDASGKRFDPNACPSCGAKGKKQETNGFGAVRGFICGACSHEYPTETA